MEPTPPAPKEEPVEHPPAPKEEPVEHSEPTLAGEPAQTGITPVEPAQTLMRCEWAWHSPEMDCPDCRAWRARKAGRYEGLCPGGRGCMCPKRAER